MCAAGARCRLANNQFTFDEMQKYSSVQGLASSFPGFRGCAEVRRDADENQIMRIVFLATLEIFATTHGDTSKSVDQRPMSPCVGGNENFGKNPQSRKDFPLCREAWNEKRDSLGD